MTGDERIVRGHLVLFQGDPAVLGRRALTDHADGAVLMSGGIIRAAGPAGHVLDAHREVPVDHYAGHLLLPGFVDAHTHYPQIGIVGAYGRQLIDWLQRYTFQAEMAFADPVHATAAARAFVDECLRHGTTIASVYCTIHSHTVDALFEAGAERGMRLCAGRMMMDRNAPDGLRDTATASYDESLALIRRWHGRGRVTYALSPRFAITSTPAQLEAAGALRRMHPDLLVQTHIDESPAEIARVRALHPDAADYLAVYERHGLVGPGTNLGHAIHLTARERAALADSGAGVSHCPTSNLFLGSGLADVHGLMADGVPVAVGTDIGAGTSFSMLATLRAAYEIAQLRGRSLDPVTALWLATEGGARLLRLGDRVGNLLPGREADLVVLDPESTPLIRRRMAAVDDVADALFVQMILADDRAIRAVYAGGRIAYAKMPGNGQRGT